MKIQKNKSRAVLYVIARFEAFRVCDFSAAATACMNSSTYSKHISKGDTGINRFYLLVEPSGVAYCFRNGLELGMVMPAGPDGWQAPTFGFATLESFFPLAS